MATMNKEDQELVDNLNKTIDKLRDDEYTSALRRDKNRLSNLKSEIVKIQALINSVVKTYTGFE